MAKVQMTEQEWENFVESASTVWCVQDTFGEALYKECIRRGWITDTPTEDKIRDFNDEEIDRICNKAIHFFNSEKSTTRESITYALKYRAWEKPKTALEKAREYCYKTLINNQALLVTSLYEQAISEQQAEIDRLKKQIESK